jgi:cell shape-determining protein MreC
MAPSLIYQYPNDFIYSCGEALTTDFSSYLKEFTVTFNRKKSLKKRKKEMKKRSEKRSEKKR